MAREVILRTRRRGRGNTAREAHVVIPATWSKSDLLAYARDEHPGETVRIVEWFPVDEPGSWEVRLWLANPAGFADYPRAHRDQPVHPFNRRDVAILGGDPSL